uniref:Neurotransmitter-gated ion-channel ligand-binding domain-containing protein n=1 Tax=Panagrolaimus davidi TaxID=227884 RepID=A0A914QKI9_9BILA
MIQLVIGGDHEKLLYDRLQHGYNKLARPVRNESAPVIVTLGMDLQQIIDVDEKSQTITTNVWIRMTWTDDPSEYGNIKEVRLPIDTIWKPDVRHFCKFYKKM